jgi:radical SAM protein with 4Fe4S-binding SPASM domain
MNAIQTNLYKLTEEKLALLKEGRFHVGVSMDLAGGVRLTAGGQRTEQRVAENMDRLARASIPFGAITVLAGHTVKHLRAIYDFMESLNLSFRVLPLFAAPLNTPGASFAVSNEEMAAALCDLFLYWLERDFSVTVAPLKHYLQTALLQIHSLESTPWRRREHGDGVLIVNTDGSLYQVIDAYEEGKALGNLFHQPIEEILASEAYAASLDRNDALEAEHCAACAFRDTCTHGPVFESRMANLPAGAAPSPTTCRSSSPPTCAASASMPAPCASWSCARTEPSLCPEGRARAAAFLNALEPLPIFRVHSPVQFEKEDGHDPDRAQGCRGCAARVDAADERLPGPGGRRRGRRGDRRRLRDPHG